jgi:hypothetical protein
LVGTPAGSKRRQRHNGRGNMKGKKGKRVLMKCITLEKTGVATA